MTVTTTDTHTRSRPQRRIRDVISRNPIGYTIPMVVLLCGFAVYPIFVLFRMSFSDVGPSNIVGHWDFVGFQNYVGHLTSSELWRSLARTLGICALLLCANLIFGFIIASILSVRGRTSSIVLAITVFIWALPPLVSGTVWRFLLDDDGAVNAALGLVGISSISWLSNPSLALWAVGAVIVWANLPFSTLIFRGGLMGIPQDLIEAAAIDGAGYWRTRLSIVLPLLRPTIWILAILTVIYAFKSFDFFYVLTQGGPGTATYTLPVQAYYDAFDNYNMSSGATVAVLSMVIVAIFAVPYVRSIRGEDTQ